MTISTTLLTICQCRCCQYMNSHLVTHMMNGTLYNCALFFTLVMSSTDATKRKEKFVRTPVLDNVLKLDYIVEVRSMGSKLVCGTSVPIYWSSVNRLPGMVENDSAQFTNGPLTDFRCHGLVKLDGNISTSKVSL